MLCFGGTRTHHRLMSGIEDAGWEIRDAMCWLYGSGFPKSHNIAKSLDGQDGRSGAITPNTGKWKGGQSFGGGLSQYAEEGEELRAVEFIPKTEQGKLWNGYGTALKPAYEPVIVAMKPLKGTFAANATEFGVAGMNIDGCRIGEESTVRRRSDSESESGWKSTNRSPVGGSDSGRWPANVLLGHTPECEIIGKRTIRGDNRKIEDKGNRGSGFVDTGAGKGDGKPNAKVYGDTEVDVWKCSPDCPIRMLDEQTGVLKSGSNCVRTKTGSFMEHGGLGKAGDVQKTYGDKGGASRFYFCAKASKQDRGEGNTHPTVKPIDLMRWLVRLIKMPTGTRILDPFCGSGSTLVAAFYEDVEAVGIEQHLPYVEIARARLAALRKNTPLFQGD